MTKTITELHDILLNACRKSIDQGYQITIGAPLMNVDKTWQICPLGALILQELYDPNIFTVSFCQSFGKAFDSGANAGCSSTGTKLGKVFRDYCINQG